MVGTYDKDVKFQMKRMMTDRLQFWATTAFGAGYYITVLTRLPLKHLTFLYVECTCLDPSGFCTNGFMIRCNCSCTHWCYFSVSVKHFILRHFNLFFNFAHDYTKTIHLNIFFFFSPLYWKKILAGQFLQSVTRMNGWDLDTFQEQYF